jgi:hypothetical protein
MRDFDREMTDHQVRWRREHVSTQEPGVQNKVTRPWLLPRWAWEESLWPPLRGTAPESVHAHLTARRIARHSGCHNLKSSWVSGVNLYFTFGRSEAGRALLAGFLAAHVDPRVRSLESLELEWAGDRELTPRTLLGETGGRRGRGQTSPDLGLVANRGDGLLLVENKLVEHSFYACSARTGSGSATRPGHQDPARCDDAAALVAHPSLCHQHALGRRYWSWLHDRIDAEASTGLARCPAATAGYQLFRQQALAEALASSRRYGFVASVLAVDGRNERLARCLAPCGLADVRDWGRLVHGRASFAVFTHQEWAAWVRAHDPCGAWAHWSTWIARRYGI